MKVLRIIFFYILFFVLCMFGVVTVLESWSVGAQMLFAIGTPAVIVWWRERRRAAKLEEKAVSAPNAEPDRAHNTTSVPVVSDSSVARVQKMAEPGKTYSPQKQDNAALVRAARAARPSLEAIATQYEQEKLTRGSASRRQGWVPKGETVTVAGREIGGMVYVGTPPLLNTHGYRDKSRASIDPSLSVASSGKDKQGDGMPYWPGYSDISPVCRATYLDWLSSARSDPSYNPGYLFLYFYGLEQRFVLDSPSDEEKRAILEEVRRLQRIYPDNGSVQRYLGEFIEIAQMSLNEEDFHEPVFDNPGWEVPLSVKVIVGAKVDNGEPLPSDWLLSWFLCHPEKRLRTVATRCSEEFRELFRLRFQIRFPDGLKVTKPRKILQAAYRAASSEFQAEISPMLNGKPVSDISGLRKPIEIAQEIADEVMDDLDKLSRYLGRNPDGRGSLEAQALLPSELWELFPSEKLESLKSWAREQVENGGLVLATEAVERLEGERPKKIGKRQLTGAADALARIGYGMAPDPRFALRSPKPDEPVVIFELSEVVEQLEDVSVAYRAALVELALGAFVAHADGRIAEGERKALQDQASKVEGLTDSERKRLNANLEWLLAVPPDMALLRRKLKDTGTEQQEALRAAVVAIAHADSTIHAEEVAGIEKIYKALGLDTALVYSDLHAGEVADGPVRVKTAEEGAPGEAIPEDEPIASTRLDSARIAAIRSDTERVSSVLGQIFSADEEMDEDVVDTLPSVLVGLDPKHAALVRALVEQEHWSEQSFADLSQRHGLLPAGALETVNEWAFEHYDEALLDEYDGYDVAPAIAEALRTEFDKEV